MEQIAGALFRKNSTSLKEAKTKLKLERAPQSDKLLVTNRFLLSHIRLVNLCV